MLILINPFIDRLDPFAFLYSRILSPKAINTLCFTIDNNIIAKLIIVCATYRIL